jgi:hypothetical protein
MKVGIVKLQLEWAKYHPLHGMLSLMLPRFAQLASSAHQVLKPPAHPNTRTKKVKTHAKLVSQATNAPQVS